MQRAQSSEPYDPLLRMEMKRHENPLRHERVNAQPVFSGGLSSTPLLISKRERLLASLSLSLSPRVSLIPRVVMRHVNSFYNTL